MRARAWGTILIPENAMKRTKIATTIRAMAPAVMTACLSFGHERRCAPDLDHLHPGAGLERLVVVVRPRGPPLTVESHAPDALAVGDPLEHHRLLAHERRGAGAD